MAIEIRGKGPPPLHVCAWSINGVKHPHRERVMEYKRAAQEAMSGKEKLLRGNLVMEVEYGSLYPKTDPVNVVFAFPNMFEGVVYQDDNQIREVHCWERKSDECVVRFRNI